MKLIDNANLSLFEKVIRKGIKESKNNQKEGHTMPIITQSTKDDIIASKEHEQDKLFNLLTDNYTQSDYHYFSMILRREINKSNYPSIYEYLTQIGEDETVEDIINEVIDDVMEYFEQ